MRRFLTIWSVCTAVLLAGVALLNVIVDPYWVFGTPTFAGLNQRKTQAIRHAPLAKSFLIERSDAATVLIGGSRVELGLNPESPNWLAAYRPVFNFGLAGSGLSRRYNALKQALAVTKPKLVIVEVTFEDCFLRPPILRRASQGMRPSVENDQVETSELGTSATLQRAKDTLFSLWSLNAFADSMYTVMNPRAGSTSQLTGLGFNTGEDFRSAAEQDGYGFLFAVKNPGKMQSIAAWAKQPKLNLEPVSQMIALAADHGAAVVVAITPGHADELEMYRNAGIWDRYLAWRRDLVALVENFEAEETDVSLWDFSGFAQYTTERVPLPGDRQHKLKWFWETNHFKVELGDLVIARLMGGGPDDFGARLTSQSVGDLNSRLESDVREYEMTHPKDVERVQLVYQKSLGR